MKRIRPADLLRMEGEEILFFGQLARVYARPIEVYGMERNWPHVRVEENGQELGMPLADGDYIGFWDHKDKLQYRVFGEPLANPLRFPYPYPY
jgi:hypothetical protein